MALFTVHVVGVGKPLNGAAVTIYGEKPDVAEGAESAGFLDEDKQAIYADYQMLIAEGNPGQTDRHGDFKFHVQSGTIMSIKVSKISHGTEWYRFQEATGSDIL